MAVIDNIFAHLPGSLGDETFDTLLESKHVKIERIISRGASSPAGFWYDQEQDEWVVLLKGKAVLSFEDGQRTELAAGDHLLIPATKSTKSNPPLKTRFG